MSTAKLYTGCRCVSEGSLPQWVRLNFEGVEPTVSLSQVLRKGFE